MRYARTWFLLFRGPLLYRVQSPLRLRQSWRPAVVRQLYRLGSPERTNGSIGMRISRSGCKNQCYDEETGLHYSLIRYYEPEAGRFVKYSYSLMIKGKIVWIEKYF